MILKIEDRSGDIFVSIAMQIDSFRLSNSGRIPDIIQLTKEQELEALMGDIRKGWRDLNGRLSHIFGIPVLVTR